MNSTQKIKGFTIIEILIVVLVLVLSVVGFLGWKFFYKDSSSDGSNTTDKLEKIDTSKLKFDQESASADPFNDSKGPYYHDVYTATSTDGINYTATNNKIAKHASVPDVIKLPSGQLVFYAVDGAKRSISGAMLGVSEDNGKTWKLGSVQINKSLAKMADPQVVMGDDGHLRIYYTVFDNKTTTAVSQNKIASAVSNDGINFDVEPGNRIEYVKITDADVIKIQDGWFMYLSQGPNLLYATSSSADGEFVYKGKIRDSGSVSKTVAQNNVFRQFYCDNKSGGVYSQTSTDGINWSNATKSLVRNELGAICDPSPVQINNNNWLMVYKIDTSAKW